MRYLARRLVHSTLLLLGVSIFSFAILQLAPGDFFTPLSVNPQISARTVATLRSQYGLDKPFPIRYEHWLHSVFRGDLGLSFAYGTPVAPLLAVRARNTLLLTGTSLLARVAAGDSVRNMERRAPRKMERPRRRNRHVFAAHGSGPGLVSRAAAGGCAHRMVSHRRNDVHGIRRPEHRRQIEGSRRLIFFCRLSGWCWQRCPPLVRHIRSAMIEVLEAPFVRAARAHGIPEQPRAASLRAARRGQSPDYSFRLFDRRDAQRVFARGSCAELARRRPLAGGRNSGKRRLRGGRHSDALICFPRGRKSPRGRACSSPPIREFARSK